ncbi:hypothetical protein TruAng_002917 [Truncatella angustata]|nr:hypothetical protein TruAng_002917 [Truncatella angustata]
MTITPSSTPHPLRSPGQRWIFLAIVYLDEFVDSMGWFKHLKKAFRHGSSDIDSHHAGDDQSAQAPVPLEDAGSSTAGTFPGQPSFADQQTLLHDAEPPRASSDRTSIPTAHATSPSSQTTLLQSTAPPSLWSCAYEALRGEDAQLVDRYEKLLSKELLEHGASTVVSQDTIHREEDLDHVKNRINIELNTRQDQLKKILDQSLQQADERKTKYIIFGREFVLKDQVAQATHFIQKIKGLVDEAVKVSPEASLAWAGVCVLLPLLANPSAAEKETRDGLSYVTSRIRYYVELERLLWPENLYNPGLKGEFENHIVDLYKHILEFQFKTVLRLYRKSVAQVSRDMIRYDDWDGVLKRVKELEQVVREESCNVNSLAGWRNLEALKTTAERHYNEMRVFLQSWLLVAEEQLQVSKRANEILEDHPIELPTVNEARYDSADVQDSPRCEDGTRASIQEKIAQWASEEVGEPLLWLLGPAGTGKSTIARTVANSFAEKKQLLAGYFFKRGEQGRNNTARLFPTIAMQLVGTIPSFKGLLRQHLDSLDKDAVETKALKFQFDQLLLEPLAYLPPSNVSNQTKVIIVDALDECECTEDQLLEILDLLCQFQTLGTIRLRVLVTSRLTPGIARAFKPIQQKKLVRKVDLHREFSKETQADIQTFLKTRFAEIKIRASVQRTPWPSPKELDRLVQLATDPEPLFIYAATLCRFVYDEQRPKNPQKQLTIWLEQCSSNKSQLNQIYEPILSRVFLGNEDADFDQQLQFLGGLILLANPLPAASIAALLGMDLDDINWWLPQLHAVLDIPAESYRPIRLLHKSFSDFLLSPDDSSASIYRINSADTHAILAVKCVRRMKLGLRRNICDIQTLSTSKDEIDKQIIGDCIPPDLRYACLYWVHHLQCSKRPIDNDVCTFLYEYFLHWLEALSLLGRLSDGAVAVTELIEIIKNLPYVPSGLADFMYDARRFILSQKRGIEFAPLQVYVSALVFSPTNSLIRKLFNKEYPPWIELEPKVEATWNACLQTLEGHDSSVYSVAFSSDGQRVASGSGDRKVKIWDATGDCIQTLEGHDGSIYSVTFSSDGQRMATGSDDKMVKIWDATSGDCIQTLEGHHGSVYSVAFSSDGQRVASGSDDTKAKIWDVTSGDYIQTLEGHNDWVRSVAFSSNGQRVVSGSDDRKVKIWDVTSGDCIQTLEGHNNWVYSVAFSSDGQRVASGSYDKKVKIWDVKSGSCIQTFEGHDGWVHSVAFSSDGQRVASGSYDKKVKIWDATSGDYIQTLEGHDGWVYSVAFSNDGQRVATGSTDTKIKIWDVTSGNHVQTLKGHDDLVRSVAFSSNGQQVASGSDDKRVNIWDTTSGDYVQTLKGHDDWVRTVTFSSNSQQVASGSDDKKVKIWDVKSGDCIQTLKGHDSWVYSVAFSSNGQRVVSGSNDTKVKIWDVESGDCIQTLEGHNGSVYSVAFSSDGQRVASGSYDKKVKIWDATSGDYIQTLEGHDGWVYSVAFSNDGQRVATGSTDTKVKIWDVISGDCIQTLPVGYIINSLSFDPENDSRLLYTFNPKYFIQWL